jgi:membrane protease YdiL (CAAX protease family)
MDVDPQAELLAVNSYGGLILLAGIVCLTLDIVRSYRTTKPPLLPWTVPWTEALFFSWLCIAGLFLGMVSTPWVMDWAGGDYDDRGLLSAYAFSQAIILAVLVLGAKIRPAAFPPLESTAGLGRQIGAGLFYCLAAFPLLAIIGYLWQGVFVFWKKLGFPVEAPPQDMVTRMMASSDNIAFGLAVVVAVLLAPLIEEVIFRAGLYRFMKSRFSPRFALIISALTFAFVHFNLFSFIPLLLLGLLLTRAYEKTGSLAAVVAMHAFFNLNTLIVLRLQPGGGG